MAEDFVQAVAEKAFSPDFVFRSPRRVSSKEVTDILILFDDTALVIQAKAQAPSATGYGYDSGPSIDWASKHLAKAGRQVSGAVRSIRAGQVKFVENRRRGRIPFNQADFPFIHGVILIDHKSEPYEASTLVPELARVQVPIHTLSFVDFMNLAKILDAPNDLVNYFDARTEVLVPSFRPMVHEENKTFGRYLARLEEITVMRSGLHGKPVTEADVKTYAEGLRQIVQGNHPSYKSGLVIDQIIDRLHDLDPKISSVRPQMDEPIPDRMAYARIATELGKITRIRRIELGQRYLSTALKAAQSGKTSWVRAYSKSRDSCLLLVCTPHARNERQKRVEELRALTAFAKAYHMVSKAIGVATEPAGQMGSSYDVVLLESPPKFDAHAQEIGRQIFSFDANN